ncbi:MULTISPECIES: phosphoadenylyl-sulfate reductase [unclassified Desulfurobacterium]|uniref:phosphoadenylyl-sulfate reductase n=1 Tax=Desulfurobacterium sp. TC5-1 TaxID=1158318 RepID=UPI0003B66029|nr:phosphoadenylyl-sulfate reductase [Desulfurobacterium sp. TC5-1]
MKNYESFSPQELLEEFILSSSRPVITSSFSVNSVVILDMALKIKPDIEVVLIDTGLLFKETYEFAEYLKNKWNINLIFVEPALSLEEQGKKYGKELWNRDPDLCCRLRKVAPLDKFLEDGVDLWITGMRRDQSPTRKNLKKVEIHRLPSGRRITKLAPVADWDRKKVWNYVFKNKLPYNPLYDKGYTSFGCVPCTSLPISDDERSGRWPGKGKLECGIHTFTEKEEM